MLHTLGQQSTEDSTATDAANRVALNVNKWSVEVDYKWLPQDGQEAQQGVDPGSRSRWTQY